MIVNDRITDYIRSLESSQGSLLDSIEQEAERERVPIIRRETAALLRTLVAALRPARILEIGTAVGYSSLLMCRVMPENCRITTIEKYEKRQVRKGVSPFWKGMQMTFWPDLGARPLTWCSWMPQKASTCTGCP